MTNDFRSPAELRRMFGANLRLLSHQYPSVSELCRQLGINRTQYNRYLSGESFPRPDVLDRICRFFKVDARILLKPLDEIAQPFRHPAASALTEFLGSGPNALPETLFPAGFYYATESALDSNNALRHRLFYARRLPQCTLVRSYEPRPTMPEAPPKEREVQGIAACAGRQIYILMSQRDAQNSRMFLISHHSGDQAGQLRGVAIRLSDTSTDPSGTRRIMLRHLGSDRSAVFGAARAARAWL